MTTTLMAVYDQIVDARDAVYGLLDAGFQRGDLGLAARGDSLDNPPASYDGGASGGVLGVIAGLASVTVPRIGPVYTVGPLASALAAAAGGTTLMVSGAATRSITAALSQLELSEEEADYYAENLRRGAAIVAVAVNDGGLEAATEVLGRYAPADIKQRLADWRQQGWLDVDPDAESDHTNGHRHHINIAAAAPRVVHVSPTPAATLSLGSLASLFQYQLLEHYSAEIQLYEALPTMAEAATEPQVILALKEHLEITQKHVVALRKLLDALNVAPDDTICQSMRSLLAATDAIIRAEGGPVARDFGLLAMAQKIVHFEIAGCGNLRQWALSFGAEEIASILKVILDQEYQIDNNLSALVERLLQPLQPAAS